MNNDIHPMTLEEEFDVLGASQDPTLYAECVRIAGVSESIRQLEEIVVQVKENCDNESYSILTRS
jgi:hypothetical protein